MLSWPEALTLIPGLHFINSGGFIVLVKEVSHYSLATFGLVNTVVKRNYTGYHARCQTFYT